MHLGASMRTALWLTARVHARNAPRPQLGSCDLSSVSNNTVKMIGRRSALHEKERLRLFASHRITKVDWPT